jgi:hypothetical protein
MPDGYELRSAMLDDLVGVAAVLLASDLADVGESHFDADYVRDQWSAPGVEPPRTAGRRQIRTPRSSLTRSCHRTARASSSRGGASGTSRSIDTRSLMDPRAQ